MSTTSTQEDYKYVKVNQFLTLFSEDKYQTPYETVFSFEKYLREFKSKSDDQSSSFAKNLASLFEEAEECMSDKGVESCAMMQSKAASFLLPSMFFENEKSFISKPFSKKFSRTTQSLHDFFSGDDWELELSNRLLDKNRKIISIGSFILKECYGIEGFESYQDQLKFRNTKNGLIRFEEIEIKPDYVEVIERKPLLPLSEDQIRSLLENYNDPDLWLELLPPDRFFIKGFVMGTLHDITKINIHSLMRKEINTVADNEDPIEKIQKIRNLFRSYLSDPDIELGIANLQFMDLIKSDSVNISLTDELDIRNISSPKAPADRCLYSDTIYRKKTVIQDDLARRNPLAPAEKRLLANGIQSVILIPVENEEGKVVAVLEIGSKKQYGVNSLSFIKLEEMINLMKQMIINFSDELGKQVALVIRDHFTSIHPSVEWKFKEVATKYQLNLINSSDPRTMDEIRFENVYPLYGQADIVGSSTLRTEALMEDLKYNIKALIRLIDIWLQEKQLFLLSSYKLKLNEILTSMASDFDTSDESQIIELLHSEIHPLLEELKGRHDILPSAPYAEYISILDEQLGIVYNKRKLFDQSVTTLNRKLSTFFNKADREMQGTLPHFFEKYKTDGVEYNIYLGQSILENGHFSENDLKEFRLWQLKNMVDATRLVKELSPTLPIPVVTAQLIFVFNNELNIKFRMEEKKFDVDGAYNVRYEILKKRIDKATIKGTNERLTQADKIAIVYLNDREKREYLEYIRFLQYDGLIDDNVEELELNKLPGADGLKAIRLSVLF